MKTAAGEAVQPDAVEDKTEASPQVVHVGVPESRVVGYVPERTVNTLNIEQFADFDLPFHHRFSLGNRSPAFSDWSGAGELAIFRKGVTHVQHVEAFTESEAPASRASIFVMYYHLLDQAAQEIVGRYPVVQPIIDWVAAYRVGADTSGIVIPWEALTDEINHELGIRMADRVNTAWNVESGTWDRPTEGAFVLLDEEQIPGYDDDAHRHYAQTLTAIAQRYPGTIFNFYGHIYNGWYLYSGPRNYPHGYTDDQIKSFRDGAQYPWYTDFDGSALYQAGIASDISPGYARTPLVRSTIYQKDGQGEYLLDGEGKRQLRTDNFYEEIFGVRTPMFAENTASIRQFRVGYDPNAPERHDIEWMLEGVYKWHDYLSFAALGRARGEYGDYNTSIWRERKLKSAITFRPVTEPWTDGGNSHWVRELGDAYIKYMLLFAWFSGVDYVETWDDGFINSMRPASDLGSNHRIKPSGEPIYAGRMDSMQYRINDRYPFEPENTPVADGFWIADPVPDYFRQDPDGRAEQSVPSDDNYSRYLSMIAANATFARAFGDNRFDYSDPTFRYLWFNVPVHAFRNKEILANGIYQGDRLALLMMYPYHDTDDRTEIELAVGEQIFHFTLVDGRDTKLFYFDVPAGVEPVDITMKYRTIDGRLIHVNAVNTGDKDEHYVEMPN